MLPKLPENIYRKLINKTRYRVKFGEFYFVAKDDHLDAVLHVPIGTLLVEISFGIDLEPGFHWAGSRYLTAVPVDVIMGRKVFEYHFVGFRKSILVKVRDDKHYLELVLKYTGGRLL